MGERSHDLLALAAVAATADEEAAELVRRVLAQEPEGGPFGDLVSLLAALAPR